MTSSEVISDIKEFCKNNANEANLEKYSRYFKDGYHGYGLTQPQISLKTKELLKNPDLTLGFVLEIAPDLIKSTMYEEVSFALLLFNGFGKHYTRQTFEEIGKWYAIGIRNWAHADTLGMFILPQFLKRNVVTYNDFSSWIKSPHKFQRRSVPVTLIKHIKLNRNDDFSPFFEFLEPLMMDSEREVHQGMGWFLREAWKLKNAETEAFLLKWKNEAPRLIFQYATEKMTAEDKMRFKRNK